MDEPSPAPTPVAVVTGGAGFLGTRLIRALLAGADDRTRVVCVDRVAAVIDDPRVVSVVGDVAEPGVAREAIHRETTAVWHLAAVLSGQSEAEPDLAWRVNVGATQHLLDACRACAQPPRFVFASTIAVFGGPLPREVPDDLALRPQSTYGTTKAIAELQVLEATRRGVVDGIVVRVPTVAIRPGVPNSAMSSFVSGIVREPIDGVASVCPVPLDTRLWVSSPNTTTANLRHAGLLDADQLGEVRTVNLPGITVTPAALLASLDATVGRAARELVTLAPDPLVSRVVGGWPGAFATDRAKALGFAGDTSAAALVTEFLGDRGGA